MARPVGHHPRIPWRWTLPRLSPLRPFLVAVFPPSGFSCAPMFRFVRNVILLVFLLAGLAAGGFIDLHLARPALRHPGDRSASAATTGTTPLIRQVGRKYAVDPMLIKAVIWRESAFRAGQSRQGRRARPHAGHGTRRPRLGARRTNAPRFVPADLFIPAGQHRGRHLVPEKGLQHYAAKDDPVTFALAEYNAGKSRVEQMGGRHQPGIQRHRRRSPRKHLIPRHARLRGRHYRALPLLPAPGTFVKIRNSKSSLPARGSRSAILDNQFPQ